MDLIERMPEERLIEVIRLIEGMAPATHAQLRAGWDTLPEDDEPLTQEDLAALARARAARDRGEKGITHEEMGRRMRDRRSRAA